MPLYQACYNEFRRSNVISGVSSPGESIYEHYRQEISLLKRWRTFFLNYAITFLETVGKYRRLKDDITDNNLEEALRSIKLVSRLTKQEKLYMSFVFGEYLRGTKNGNWLLVKQYGLYNSYYIPYIKYPNGRVVDVYEGFVQYLELDMSLEMYLKYPAIVEPVKEEEDLNGCEFLNIPN